MPTLNPDFRGADEVIIPGKLEDLTGWTDGKVSEREALGIERRAMAELEDDMPVAFKTRAPREPMPEMLKQWNEFQESKGRYAGSNDMTLLDEFAWKKKVAWKKQIIGSCVMSNTKGSYTIRLTYEIVLLGRPEEYLGTNEFGPNNLTMYCPMTYGMARRRANMRGGDGLYCAPMAESLMKDGVLLCSTPKLIELTKRLGVGGDEDYPEPQSASVYRAFGDWKYLDELKQYLDYPVTECPSITSGDQLWDLLGDGKPGFVCSGEAIRKVGEHPDGFAIHARDPGNTWSHNMAWHGRFVASDGERFIRESNESWGPDIIYNRRLDEVNRAFQTGNLSSNAIGEIRGPQSAPVFNW